MRSPLVALPSKPPRVDHAPRARSYRAAEEALSVAELSGLDLDDWQRYALCRSMGQVAGGGWAAFEAGLVVPRQNGKTEVLLARAFAALFSEVTDDRLVIYTAHEYKTAREVFMRAKNLLDPPRDADPLSVADGSLVKQVKSVRTANGEESIELHNGRRLRFLARTSGSGRGFTGDLVILDEAYKLNGEQMAALLPTLSARPNPQVWYASMGPMGESSQQLAVRERGLAGEAGLCYLEWSIPDDGKLDDEGLWAAANPAEPHRVTVEHMRRERAAMGDEEFARERLCAHGTSARQPVIDPDVWQGFSSDTSRTVGEVAFGIDVTPDRSATSIVVAGRNQDGLVHVEVIEHRLGTEWAIDRLVQLVGKWDGRVLLDPGSPAGSLIAGLVQQDVEPELVGGREMAQACGMFYDTVAAEKRKVAHYTGHENHVKLNLAVDGARKRPVGDAWAWHRRDASVDISPLVAATLAVYGLSKPPVERKKAKKAGEMWGY